MENALINNYHPNLLAEILLCVIYAAALYTALYPLMPPSSKLRKVFFYIIVVLAVPVVRFAHWVRPLNIGLTGLIYLTPPLLLAWLCGMGNKELGGYQRAFLSAIYFCSMILVFESIWTFLAYGIGKHFFRIDITINGSASAYLIMIITYLCLLGWSVFYYRTVRSMPRASKAYSFKPFWVCILLAPAFILLLGIPAVGTIIFAEDLAGIFYIIFAGMIAVILAVDLCAFYLYSKA